MNLDELNIILARGENTRTEFKTSFNEDVIVSLVAFSNTKAAGRLGEKLGEKLDEKLDEKLGEKLGEKQKLILDAISRNQKVSIRRISEIVGVSQTAIENNIKILKQKGLIKRVGPAKGGHWEIVK